MESGQGFVTINQESQEDITQQRASIESMSSMRVYNSVATFDIDVKRKQSIAKMINSPRSLEAFKRTGITPEELEPVNIPWLKDNIASKTPNR